MASIAISSNHQALNDPKTNIPPVPMDTGKVSSKAAEAEHDTNSNQSHDNPPPYDSSSSSSLLLHLSPSYQSIQKALTSLQTGSPDETISIPMIHRKDPTSLHRLNPFSRKGYENITHYISARQMKRSQYLAHYAKDAEGNYIGTGPPAPDAGLVFVVGKGTPEELLKQAEQVALGMQKRRGDGIGKFGKPL